MPLESKRLKVTPLSSKVTYGIPSLICSDHVKLTDVITRELNTICGHMTVFITDNLLLLLQRNPLICIGAVCADFMLLTELC